MSWCLVFGTPGNNFYCYRFFQEKEHHYCLHFNKNIFFVSHSFNYFTSCASSCGLFGTLIQNHQNRFVINVWVFVWIFFFFNVLIFFFILKSLQIREITLTAISYWIFGTSRDVLTWHCWERSPKLQFSFSFKILPLRCLI